MGKFRSTGRILALLFVFLSGNFFFHACSGSSGGGESSLSNFTVNLNGQLGNAPEGSTQKLGSAISTDTCQALFRISLSVDSVVVFEKGVLVDLKCVLGVPEAGQIFELLSGEVISTLVKANQSVVLVVSGSLVGTTTVGEFISGFSGRVDFLPQADNSLTVVTSTNLEDLGIDPNFACNNTKLLVDIAEMLLCGGQADLCGSGDEGECNPGDPDACDGSLVFPCDPNFCSCRLIACPFIFDEIPGESIEEIVKLVLGCPGVCGNGIVDPGEECDFPTVSFGGFTLSEIDIESFEPDPKNQCGFDDCVFDFSPDDCTCIANICGDGIVGREEECDPLVNDSCGSGEECHPEDCFCNFVNICGDGEITVEECDGSSGEPNGGCEAGFECDEVICQCNPISLCGNGVKDPGEECDTGAPSSCPIGFECGEDCDICFPERPR